MQRRRPLDGCDSGQAAGGEMASIREPSEGGWDRRNRPTSLSRCEAPEQTRLSRLFEPSLTSPASVRNRNTTLHVPLRVVVAYFDPVPDSLDWTQFCVLVVFLVPVPRPTGLSDQYSNKQLGQNKRTSDRIENHEFSPD